MYRSANFEVLHPTTPGVRYPRSSLLVREDVALDLPPSTSSAATGIVFHPQDYDIETRIEASWQALQAAAQKQIAAGKRANLPFSGPLYRLARIWRIPPAPSIPGTGYDGHPESLILDLGATNFRESVGTNWEAGKDAAYKQLLKARGRDRAGNERAYFADALASCVVVRTHTERGDAVYVVGLRGGEQDEYPLSLHVPGTVGSRKPWQQKRFDPFEAAWLDCLSKEFAIEREDVTAIYCAGLVRNGVTEKPELAFVADVSVPFEQLASARHAKAPQRAEHFAIFPVTRDQALELLAGTQDPANARFLDAIALPKVARSRVKAAYADRPALIANTNNWWCPAGEAAVTLALANDGADVLALPHVTRALP